MNIAKKLQKDISNALNALGDGVLDIDVQNIGVDIHYTDEDIMNATLIFNHVIGNRMIHNLIKAKETKEDGGSKGEEMGYRLKQYVIDATGFDPSTFYFEEK